MAPKTFVYICRDFKVFCPCLTPTQYIGSYSVSDWVWSYPAGYTGQSQGQESAGVGDEKHILNKMRFIILFPFTGDSTVLTFRDQGMEIYA